MVEVYEYDLKDISSEAVIVDNEISNDISQDYGFWDYENADIICTGFLFGSKIVQVFMKQGDDVDEFKQRIDYYLKRFKSRLFAFNYRMEAGNFRGFLNHDYYINEIKPFKGKGWTMNKFFDILVKEGKVKDVSDALKNKSHDCISLYKEKKYKLILEHNFADLIKEYYVLKYKDFFLTKYGDKLDERGWYND